MFRLLSPDRFSIRLVYRTYFLLVICIVAIGTVLDYWGGRIDEAARLETYRQHFAPIFVLVRQRLSTTDNASSQAVIEAVSRQTGLSIQLHTMSDFSADLATLEMLGNNQMIGLFGQSDELTFYQRIPGQSEVIAISAPDWTQQPAANAWIVPVFYVSIAIALSLLLLPFARNLNRLKSATADFGVQKWDTRITDVPAGSTLATIVNTFNTMAERIEQLILTQRDLTNSVSHELRTPLARLRFTFEEIAALSDDQQIHEQVDYMRRDVNELGELIDEMLQYAEVSQIADMERADSPVLTVLSSVFNALPASQIDVELVVDETVTDTTLLQCNAHHLHRALANIVRNGLRFAQRHCLVHVSKAATSVIIVIADDGPGINTAKAERVFEPFYRADNQQPGHGLGLSIASSIIKKHGGIIKLIDGPLSGACFQIVLPLQVE